MMPFNIGIRHYNPFHDYVIWVDDIKRQMFESYVKRDDDDS